MKESVKKKINFSIRGIDFLLLTFVLTEYFYMRIPLFHTIIYIFIGIVYALYVMSIITSTIVLYYAVFTNKIDSSFNLSKTTTQKRILRPVLSYIYAVVIVVLLYLTGHWYFFTVNILAIVFGLIIKLPIIKNTLLRKTAKNLLLTKQ